MLNGTCWRSFSGLAIQEGRLCPKPLYMVTLSSLDGHPNSTQYYQFILSLSINTYCVELKSIKKYKQKVSALCCRMLPLAWTHASSQASISLATRSTYRRKSMLTAPMNSSAEIPHRISKIPADDLARTAIGGVFGRYCGDYLRYSEIMSCDMQTQRILPWWQILLII